jgi:hypothetical protein
MASLDPHSIALHEQGGFQHDVRAERPRDLLERPANAGELERAGVGHDTQRAGARQLGRDTVGETGRQTLAASRTRVMREWEHGDADAVS